MCYGIHLIFFKKQYYSLVTKSTALSFCVILVLFKTMKSMKVSTLAKKNTFFQNASSRLLLFSIEVFNRVCFNLEGPLSTENTGYFLNEKKSAGQHI